MDSPSTPDTPSASFMPPKRVQPQRSRRGGPGIGNCEIDEMILDTRMQRTDDEPLIPGNTKFILTTNLDVVPKSAVISEKLNVDQESYFNRPEVLISYREQQVIQTPEFRNLNEDFESGPSRSRLRPLDDGSADTSDAAYEKRHRKYEKDEKRQRNRERDQLKHEQYKLKERIEQLKSMDSSAFMKLPASSFPPPPTPSTDGESIQNGDLFQDEGERRRKEMLDAAATLEGRFRVLLPPARKTGPNVSTAYAEPFREPSTQPRTSTPGTSRPMSPEDSGESEVEPERSDEEGEQEQAEVEVAVDEEEATETDAITRKPPAKLKIKLSNETRAASVSSPRTRRNRRKSSTPNIPESPVKPLPRRKSQARKVIEPLATSPTAEPPPPQTLLQSAPSPPAAPQPSANGSVVVRRRPGRPRKSLPAPPSPPPREASPVPPNPDVATLARTSPPAEEKDELEAESATAETRPRKRARRARASPSPDRNESAPPAASISAHVVTRRLRNHSPSPRFSPRPGPPDITPPGQLRMEAHRVAGMIMSRKASAPRHNKAFGFKLNSSITFEMFYDPPSYLREDPIFVERAAKYGDKAFPPENYAPLGSNYKKTRKSMSVRAPRREEAMDIDSGAA